MVVPSVDHANAGEAVNVLAPVHIGNGGAGCALHNYRLHGFHEAGDDVVGVFLDGIGHDLPRLTAQPNRLHKVSQLQVNRWPSAVSPRPSTFLELPAVLFSPALNHDFLVGVELDGIVALGVHRAEEAFFPAAESK